jgi:hypothetical protein
LPHLIASSLALQALSSKGTYSISPNAGPFKQYQIARKPALSLSAQAVETIANKFKWSEE